MGVTAKERLGPSEGRGRMTDRQTDTQLLGSTLPEYKAETLSSGHGGLPSARPEGTSLVPWHTPPPRSDQETGHGVSVLHRPLLAEKTPREEQSHRTDHRIPGRTASGGLTSARVVSTGLRATAMCGVFASTNFMCHPSPDSFSIRE